MRKFIKTRPPPPPPRARKLPIINFEYEIIEMYGYVAPEGVVEGAEKRGRRFFTWTFQRSLGENQTPSVTARLRQNINSAFYTRHNYVCVIVNVETNLKMVYYKQQKGSLCIKNFAEAERWLNIRESGYRRHSLLVRRTS